MRHTGEQLREAWVRACLSEVGTRSVGDEDRITTYFRGIDWGWAIDQHCPGGVYDDEVRRRLGRSGPLNFCGIGPAWCGVHLLGSHIEDDMSVSVRLRPAIASVIMPSTYRIQSRERWWSGSVNMEAAPQVDDIQRGDVLAVRTGANIRWGDHIVLVTGRDGDKIFTVEFNTTGDLGDGTAGRGVVTRQRDMGDVVRAYRFQQRHFEEA